MPADADKGIGIVMGGTDGLREDGTWGVINPARAWLNGNTRLTADMIAALMAGLAKVHAVLAAESSTNGPPRGPGTRWMSTPARPLCRLFEVSRAVGWFGRFQRA